MVAETAAIILCAGIGSRMQLSGEINKCAAPIGGTSAVRHIAVTLAECGVKRITIVTGYAENSVKSSLSDMSLSHSIQFVYNPHYDYHGCNYSLACGIVHTERTRRVIIAEGDSLLHPNLIAQTVETEADAAGLIRQSSYIDFSRSVIAIGINGKITRYAYDMQHKGTYPKLKNGESVMGESMQLWSFSGCVLDKLRFQLERYYETVEAGSESRTESGVYSINKLVCGIMPVQATLPECWINLNTPNDFMKAGKIQWLKK